MKHFIHVILACMLALTLSSCNKGERPSSESSEELTFDLKVVNATDPATRAVKTEWETGDKIFLYFKKNGTTTLAPEKYAILSYNGSTWDISKPSNSNIELTTSGIGTSGIIYAVYFPFGHVVFNASTYYFRSSSNQNSALNSIPPFSFYLTNTVGGAAGNEYGLSGSVVTGTLTMRLPENFVYFFIEADGLKYDRNEKYRLCVEGVKPVTVQRYTNGQFQLIELAAGQPMWGYEYGDGICFAGIMDDTWALAADHQMIFFSDGDPAVTKTFSGKTLVSHASVKLSSPTADNGWTPYMAAPEYVEIGGNNWSKWNLGSTGANDLTNNLQFRWAEIVPDNGNGNSNFSVLISQSLTDDYVIFDPARAILGSDWRMPTRNDYRALADSCAITCNTDWFTFSEGETSIHFITHNAVYGSGGSNYLWTSTISSDDAYAYIREFHVAENEFNEYGSGEEAKRAIGIHFIRPIYKGYSLNDDHGVYKEGYLPTPLD